MPSPTSSNALNIVRNPIFNRASKRIRAATTQDAVTLPGMQACTRDGVDRWSFVRLRYEASDRIGSFDG